jgi:dienelactone hydrolase
VGTKEAWLKTRRPELLEQFRQHVYGRAPTGRPKDLSFAVANAAPNQKRAAITFSGPGGKGAIHLAIHLPNKRTKPLPAFVLMNHRAGKTLAEPGYWDPLTARGYAAVLYNIDDVSPDSRTAFDQKVMKVFPSQGGDAWGGLAAWAWGASRVMDYLETDKEIDAKRVALVGHSRSGKAALVAGAEDERFALVVSNGSGGVGSGLARLVSAKRRRPGYKSILTNYPYWFCANFRRYADTFKGLPVDQHMLVALMAPRRVYIASAHKDPYTIHPSEFLGGANAAPAWGLFGLTGLTQRNLPALNTPLQDGYIGYHIRAGKHGMTEYDWNCFLDYADKHWGRTP